MKRENASRASCGPLFQIASGEPLASREIEITKPVAGGQNHDQRQQNADRWFPQVAELVAELVAEHGTELGAVVRAAHRIIPFLAMVCFRWTRMDRRPSLAIIQSQKHRKM